MTDSNYDTKNDILLIVRDKDIFPNAIEAANTVWKKRITGKAVIFDEEGKIALIGNKVNDFFQLPGGGIEDGENLQDGLLRECKEETGCEIKIISQLGITEDYRLRDARHGINFGYSAKVVSRGTPSLTASETDVGAYVTWLPLSEVLDLFALQEKKIKAGEIPFYNTCFNIIRDFFFLRRARDVSINN